MTDKSAPRKKPAKREESVLGSLSSTRPTRMSRRAADGSSRAEATATARPKAATTKPKAATARPRATTTPRPKAAPTPRPAPPPREPDAPEPTRRTGPPSGPELVTTAVQAIGELAQIGVTLGGQALRRAARRIPRP